MIQQTYTDLILPLPLPGSFTYRVPEEMAGKLKPGCRVVVQFGNRKLYTALVRNLHRDPQESRIFKDILSVLDEKPLVPEWWYAFTWK